jgi:hypothetical protein
MTVGVLILDRSRYELSVERDYSMAIVLAAAAFESELFRVFCKWTQINQMRSDPNATHLDCEKELRASRGIADKIERVSKLLYRGGLAAFVASSPARVKDISNASLHVGSLAKDFQEMIFRPRNKILHQGYAEHTEADASKCCDIAYLGLRILQDMDKAKLLEQKL